jgi:hypothetical protein
MMFERQLMCASGIAALIGGHDWMEPAQLNASLRFHRKINLQTGVR